MSEFGNETVTAAFKMSEKTIEASVNFTKFAANLLADFFKYMTVTRPSRRLGCVDAKILQKSGEPLGFANLRVSGERLRDFVAEAKKYGFQYSIIGEEGGSGEKLHTIMCKEKDLALVKSITERMMENLKIKAYGDQINKINQKETLTAEDKKDVKILENEKDNVIRTGTRAFNNQNAEIIYGEIMGRPLEEALSFDKAFNRFTGRDYSSDAPYFVCDRTNPNNYIELVSSQDNYRGTEYTKTDYKVFKNGEEQYSDKLTGGKFTDKRFDNRPKYFWKNLKAEMKEKGGFTDDVVIFNTKAEFERYKEIYNERLKENSVQKSEVESVTFSREIEQLTKQLSDLGAELNVNNKPIDARTKEIISPDDTKTMRKEQAAECVLIAQQISNYNALAAAKAASLEAEQSLKVFELNMKTLDPRDPIYKELDIQRDRAIEKIMSLEQEMNDLYSIDYTLELERERVSGIYAVNVVDMEYIAEREKEFEREINERRERSPEKDVRSELDMPVDDGKDTYTIDEWKGKMAKLNDLPASPQPDRALEKLAAGKEDR